jgi:hypothetical protein
MSELNAETQDVSLEQVEKELNEMRRMAIESNSPVAIFGPIVSNFAWCPAEHNETGTIVLASDYGSNIDNGCIIYNPEFVHQLYKEGDMATFYAIIATIGLGVKCGYYDYRNGEGEAHTRAVQIMMAHFGVLNSLKTGNTALDTSLAALQEAYAQEDVMEVVKQVYTHLNTRQKEDPDTG